MKEFEKYYSGKDEDLSSNLNDFVVELRDHLVEKYQTESRFTNTLGDKGEERGFSFRKDLCTIFHYNEDTIRADINKFAKSNELETKIDSETGYMVMNIGNKNYAVSVYIGEGLEDNINVYFMNDLVGNFFKGLEKIFEAEN